MIKTQPPLRIFAAGSLRRAFVPWLESYRQRTGTDVIVDFGPAGLLRQRIEQGEKVDLFASANTQHPVALSQQQAVAELRLFAANRLCLTARRERVAEYDSWLDILRAPELALATSTPGSDPGGDYAQQLFDYVERFHPGEGQRIREKARHLYWRQAKRYCSQRPNCRRMADITGNDGSVYRLSKQQSAPA